MATTIKFGQNVNDKVISSAQGNSNSSTSTSSSGIVTYNSLSNFPIRGRKGIVYFAIDKKIMYFWDVNKNEYEEIGKEESNITPESKNEIYKEVDSKIDTAISNAVLDKIGQATGQLDLDYLEKGADIEQALKDIEEYKNRPALSVEDAAKMFDDLGGNTPLW